MKPQTKKNVIKWVTRTSEISGFTHAVFLTDGKGDYIRVDYNAGRRSARLTVEDRKERCVHSLIENGKIVKEWSSRGNISGSSIPAVFRSKAAVYSAVIVPQAYNLIRGNYGILRKKTKLPVRKNTPVGMVLAVLIIIAVLCAAAIFLSVN